MKQEQPKAKKFLKLRVEKRIKNYFSFSFSTLTEEVETSGKNGGASSHTWQLQEKV